MCCFKLVVVWADSWREPWSLLIFQITLFSINGFPLSIKKILMIFTVSLSSLKQLVLLRLAGLLWFIRVLQVRKTYNGKLKRFVDNWMRQIGKLKKTVIDQRNLFEGWENVRRFWCPLMFSKRQNERIRSRFMQTVMLVHWLKFFPSK